MIICSGKGFPIKALGVALRSQLELVVNDREVVVRWGPLRSYINSIGCEYFFGHCDAAPPLPHMGGVGEGDAVMQDLDLVDMIM